MFVYNMKINGSKIFKTAFILALVILFIIIGIVIFKVFHGSKNNANNSTCTPQSNINILSTKNYTNVLKTVHENIDEYVGVKIKFTGYIYRIFDFNDNQFVLARDMLISSDNKSVVVGFLCNCPNAHNFNDNSWVEVTGEITKGDYHGDMPIIKVMNITEVTKPNDEYVYPPDESYIPTSGLL